MGREKLFDAVVTAGTHMVRTDEGAKAYRAGDAIQVTARDLERFPGKFRVTVDKDAAGDAASYAQAAKRVAEAAQTELAEAQEALAGVTRERDEAMTALGAAQARIAELEAAAASGKNAKAADGGPREVGAASSCDRGDLGVSTLVKGWWCVPELAPTRPGDRPTLQAAVAARQSRRLSP